MGQWIDEGGVDREHGIEQVRQSDAMSFGNKPEPAAITIEAPRAPNFDEGRGIVGSVPSVP